MKTARKNTPMVNTYSLMIGMVSSHFTKDLTTDNLPWQKFTILKRAPSNINCYPQASQLLKLLYLTAKRSAVVSWIRIMPTLKNPPKCQGAPAATGDAQESATTKCASRSHPSVQSPTFIL